MLQAAFSESLFLDLLFHLAESSRPGRDRCRRVSGFVDSRLNGGFGG